MPGSLPTANPNALHTLPKDWCYDHDDPEHYIDEQGLCHTREDALLALAVSQAAMTPV